MEEVVVVVVVPNFSVVWAEGRLVEWGHVMGDISWRVWVKGGGEIG